jgi:hypothetical protein
VLQPSSAGKFSKVKCTGFPCERCQRLDLECAPQKRVRGRPLKLHKRRAELAVMRACLSVRDHSDLEICESAIATMMDSFTKAWEAGIIDPTCVLALTYATALANSCVKPRATLC